MTRAVIKKGQKDFVLTGAQSGVLYISNLPVEKNVLLGLERKLSIISKAFSMTYGGKSKHVFHNSSSTNIALPDQSVDYIFADPPFGDYIPYAEVNQINEAWLGKMTNRKNEAIISKAQGKDATRYQELLAQVFTEAHRTIKQTGLATIMFHSSKPDIWNAVGESFSQAGFSILKTSIWNKLQKSFKQAVSEGSTRHDALFLLSPSHHSQISPFISAETFIKKNEHLDMKMAYSLYSSRSLQSGHVTSLPATDFYALYEKFHSKNEFNPK